MVTTAKAIACMHGNKTGLPVCRVPIILKMAWDVIQRVPTLGTLTAYMLATLEDLETNMTRCWLQLGQLRSHIQLLLGIALIGQ